MALQSYLRLTSSEDNVSRVILDAVKSMGFCECLQILADFFFMTGRARDFCNLFEVL